MSLATICDGTQKPFPVEQLKVVGPLNRAYSPEVVAAAEEYLAKMDDVHSKVAALWQDWRDAARKEYREKIGGGVLPDE